jgi:fructoselysine-6-P-deglycase FrlB-like protein
MITTKWISQQMDAPWRQMSPNVMKLEIVQRSLRNLGWTYVTQKGRGGSKFVRVEAQTNTST